jgi:hypothetical protein
MRIDVILDGSIAYPKASYSANMGIYTLGEYYPQDQF